MDALGIQGKIHRGEVSRSCAAARKAFGLQVIVRQYDYFDESVGGVHGSRRENTGYRGQHQSHSFVSFPQKQIVCFSRGSSGSVSGQ